MNLDYWVKKYLETPYESGDPGSLKNMYFMNIHDTLLQERHINLNSDLYTSIYTNAVMRSLKGYDPDKGDFLHYFNTVYSFCEKQAYIDKFDDKSYIVSYIVPTVSEIRAYGEPNENSAVSRNLTKNRRYRVYDIVRAGENGEHIWFKLKLSTNSSSSKETAYIHDAPQIQYHRFSSESLYYEDDDGNEEIKPVPDNTASADDRILGREDLEALIGAGFSAFLEFHKKTTASASSTDTSGHLTVYDCYRMFYTEDLIDNLHQHGDNYYPPYPRETLVMRLADKRWMDYLMTEHCRGFRKIIETPRHNYDHYLHNGNNEEISLPPEIAIRGRYIREHLHIKRDESSLKVSITKHRKSYNEIWKAKLKK